jgi:hypothetical protein
VAVIAERFQAGLDEIRSSPSAEGTIELIVRRPGVEEREPVEEADLSVDAGLVGDNWLERGTRKGRDPANPLAQLTLINSRLADLVAGERERWALAGDQLYVDFDLSADNLPPWTRLAVGSAVIEVTDEPHTGCAKFSARFGSDALRFVNSAEGRKLHLRGINARVVEAGTVRRADAIRKL